MAADQAISRAMHSSAQQVSAERSSGNSGVSSDATGAAADVAQIALDHTKIKGNFSEYRSGYWALTVPLLSARYIADGLNKILKPGFVNKDLPGWTRKLAGDKGDKGWAMAVGVSMIGVTAYYSNQTYKDIKSQFKEPLAWEFNKDSKNVGIMDMMRSKNTLVHETVKNFAKRTLLRFAMHLPFFTYLIPTPFKQQAGETARQFALRDKLAGPKEAVNLGVGTNAMYLASDALGRKKSFFEELQSFIDNKINHKSRIGEMVTSADLLNLYDLQARNNKKAIPLPTMDSPEWQSSMKLFDRMADLMNQTYGNVPKREHADFTVPKLVYMLGMGVLSSEHLEHNLDFVEIANSHGIPAVKKVVEAAQNQPLETALAAYPATRGVHPQAIEQEQQAQATSFAHEGLRKTRPETQASSHAERARQTAEASPVLGA